MYLIDIGGCRKYSFRIICICVCTHGMVSDWREYKKDRHAVSHATMSMYSFALFARLFSKQIDLTANEVLINLCMARDMCNAPKHTSIYCETRRKRKRNCRKHFLDTIILKRWRQKFPLSQMKGVNEKEGKKLESEAIYAVKFIGSEWHEPTHIKMSHNKLYTQMRGISFVEAICVNKQSTTSKYNSIDLIIFFVFLIQKNAKLQQLSRRAPCLCSCFLFLLRGKVDGVNLRYTRTCCCVNNWFSLYVWRVAIDIKRHQ